MILFVGDRPSPKMKPGAAPFQGAGCEARLMEWIKALGVSEYMIINASEHDFYYYATVAKDVNYPIVALGNNASRALKGAPHFKLPHPSGRNRQTNDKKFISQKLEECRKWLQN